jgi:hypothetical protein
MPFIVSGRYKLGVHACDQAIVGGDHTEMVHPIAKAIDIGEQLGCRINLDLYRTHALHGILPGCQA